MKHNIIINKYLKIKNIYIFELIVNLYLMDCEYRNIFQIHMRPEFDKNSDKNTDKIIKIIKMTNYEYITSQNKDSIRIIVYNKDSFDITKLDKTFGMKYAKQLGNFYTCATNNFSKNNYQMTINVNGIQIFAQMCKKNNIIKNMNKL